MMNRRQLLRGFVALAAAAAVGPALIPVTSAEQIRLVEMIKSGIVRDQTFVFEAGESIPLVNDLIIHNCHFVWRGVPPKDAMLNMVNRSGVTISQCMFSDLTSEGVGVRVLG